MIGIGILIFVVIACLLAPVLSPYGYEEQDLRLGATPPSATHWLGTDTFGRDLLTRILYGGQVSLAVGFIATIVALLVGVTYGAIAGYVGGRVDAAMMRLVDIIYALPFMIFIILLMVVFGRNLFLLFLAIGAVEWLTMARIVRGQGISIIFQDPMISLNPFLKIGDQSIEPLRLHEDISRKAAWARATTMLEEVGIKDAARRMNAWPFEFSGGMRQRVMIAMALITEPDIIIADEPTTALDVTVQAQILKLIRELQQRRNIGVIFISHDLSVVADIADTLAVMQEGVFVEQGSRDEIFQDPYASLNPRMPVYDALAEPLLLHGIVNRKGLDAEVFKLMDSVGLARAAALRYLSDRILIMKDGKLVESGTAHEIFSNPREEYTRQLLAAIPGKSLLLGEVGSQTGSE